MTTNDCYYIGSVYPISDSAIYIVQFGNNIAPITVDASGNRRSLF